VQRILSNAKSLAPVLGEVSYNEEEKEAFSIMGMSDLDLPPQDAVEISEFDHLQRGRKYQSNRNKLFNLEKNPSPNAVIDSAFADI
jgi:hypothetical protein